MLDFHNPLAPSTVRFKEPLLVGEKIATLEGYDSFMTDAARKGEIVGANWALGNGNITSNLIDVDSNAYGEVKIKLPYGATAPGAVIGESLFWNPYAFVVTLSKDNFEYEIDTKKFYYVKVTFDLDEWK